MALASAPGIAAQPYLGIDIVAWVLMVVAGLCLVIRLRDGDKGMGWFAISFAALGLWLATESLHRPIGLLLVASPWWYLMCIAMAAMGPGLAAYLNLQRPARTWAIGGVLLPAAAFAGTVTLVALTGAEVYRVWLHSLTAIAFAVMSMVAFSAARREPGAGHVWLGLALASVPAFAAYLAARHADPVALRYWAVLPAAFVGLILPSVSLLRRRRALQAEIALRSQAEAELAASNASLEVAVAQRTADLQSMVTGLESFNRSVSHDLRGPLGGIAGLAGLARDAWAEGDDSLARRALPIIMQQAEASERLVTTLLELARVGDAPMQRRTLDPGPITREVIEQVRQGLSGGAPQFLVRELPAVDADPDLLRVILVNLIGNAAKFSSDRRDARVEISAEPHEGAVCLQVCDNGVGFDGGDPSALFTPFRRLHGARFEGHGVGLSIVRRAVERHGGRIWAADRAGEGACFSFTLPSSRREGAGPAGSPGRGWRGPAASQGNTYTTAVRAGTVKRPLARSKRDRSCGRRSAAPARRCTGCNCQRWPRVPAIGSSCGCLSTLNSSSSRPKPASARPRPSSSTAISTGFCSGPVLWNCSRRCTSSALRSRSRRELARMASRSRKAPRVKAMSAAVGRSAGSASRGAISGCSAALSRSGGRPLPKWLSAPDQSMRLNQSPES